MNLPSKYSFIELNPELEKILNIIQDTNENLCVLGAAGCLTGDTIIRASRARRGFRMPLEELYKKFNSIEGRWDSSFSTYARSYDEETNQIKLNEITDVFESGVKPIFELILEDGSNLRGTYDHKVMTVEGWKELGELTSKDFVLVDKTTRWSKSGRITIEQKRKAKMKYNDKKISIGLFYPNKRVSRYTRTRERAPKYVGVEHILTYEAYINNVAIDDIVNASYDPKLASKYEYINTNTHAVHHKDGNHKNNAISNLECISHHEHLRQHSLVNIKNIHHGIPIKVKVKEVKDTKTEEMTYDISCASPYHSFVANDMIVHNCGKSLTIQLLSDRTFYNHNTIVCCPTGISAINASTENIKAQTIHSLFRLPSMSVIPVDHLKTYSELRDLFVNLHTLIIDEISMVNSDLLTKIVYLLNQYRNGEPVRIIVFGDPSQLAPVVSTEEEQNYLDDIYGSRFFFHSDVFTSMHVVHLNKIYRQSDSGFKEILNRFRMDNATDEDYRVINSRVMDISEFGDNALYVALTNKTVNRINDRELQKNPNPFKVYHGEVSNFHPLPVPKELYLKLDAQVMITANNKSVGYYNGLLGKIVKFNKDTIDVETEYGTFSIEKYKWGKYGHEYDKGSGQIKAYEIGYYKQFPIKVAYALTSHKTQGLTLDKMYLDLERGTFASGQLYTSLSRVRSLDGLGLARSIHKCDSKISGVIKKFYKKIEKTEKSV